MKRTILSLIIFLGGLSAMAQEKLYICDKYDSDSYELSELPEFSFYNDYESFTIGKDSYDVADIDSIVFTKPQFPAVNITWNGTSASVEVDSSIKGVTYSISGAHVTITSTNTTDELLYVLQGSSSNGSLTLNGSYKLTMHLNGVNLTSEKGAAIDIECGKRIELKLMKDTENTLVDCSSGKQKAALFCKGHLEIKGKGTLNVTGNTKHAICANEYLMIKKSTGTINILGAKSDGIHCGAGSKLAADAEDVQFIMKGGTLNISGCEGDCIDSDDYGIIKILDGTANLDVSQLDGVGLKADSIFYMTGGDIEMEVSGSISHGIRCNYDAYFDGGIINGNITGLGAKGIKAKKTTTTTATVKNGGDAHFRGTNISFNVTAGIYTIDQSKCMGIRVDKDMYQTDGDIHITVTNEDAIGIDIKGTDYNTGGTRIVD